MRLFAPVESDKCGQRTLRQWRQTKQSVSRDCLYTLPQMWTISRWILSLCRMKIYLLHSCERRNDQIRSFGHPQCSFPLNRPTSKCCRATACFYFNFSFVFIAIRVVHSQSMNATILLRRQFHGGFIRRLSPSVWSIHFVFNFILWISNLILYFSLNDLRLRDIHECRRCSRHSFRKNGFYRAHVARSAHKIALRWNRMDFYDRQWKGLHVSFTCFLWDWLWRS